MRLSLSLISSRNQVLFELPEEDLVKELKKRLGAILIPTGPKGFWQRLKAVFNPINFVPALEAEIDTAIRTVNQIVKDKSLAAHIRGLEDPVPPIR
jgi:hypothetical protein